jgi:hypothetical protein
MVIRIDTGQFQKLSNIALCANIGARPGASPLPIGFSIFYHKKKTLSSFCSFVLFNNRQQK